MNESRESAAWNRSSISMALLHWIGRLQSQKPPRALQPADFNPYKTRKAQTAKADVALMRTLFQRKKKKKAPAP